MADGDLKDAALNSTEDFYELLGVTSTASETEIRSAWRRTALKYHPDKVGANDKEAAEKFYLLQIALDVLSDENLRPLYDNARRAREEKKQRDAAYDVRRRNLKEDLERRESAGVAGLKRKRGQEQEEDKLQRELERLAADGARRRKQREEELRKGMQEGLGRDSSEEKQATPNGAPAKVGVEEVDRTIKLRYPTNTLDEEALKKQFSRFGKIQDIVLRNKKIKVEGEKHRRDFTIALIVFESIVGAHAAVTDTPELAKSAGEPWGAFEEVKWASGKEPDYIPKPKSSDTPVAKAKNDFPTRIGAPQASPVTAVTERIKNSDPGLKRVPSFGSFKGTPKASVGHGGLHVAGSPSSEELMMMRLKNAERKRLAEQIQREEAAEAQDA
ncbi:Pre-mRNA-splicing factor cwf23 [Lecanosticta acicola]|uniref:Pre-mRNA-splicing factor cwf23 n=1 Tax=Lecanosticta acicola TaxID=111012 RepID=A0AAI8YS36_9PEZI|nr:Pre-mRNA-splicing factor cwf23 [Lecanosticta acicola]